MTFSHPVMVVSISILVNEKKYIVNSSDLKKWQVMGFEDYVSFCGYLSTNGLNNLVKDFDAVYADKEE